MARPLRAVQRQCALHASPLGGQRGGRSRAPGPRQVRARARPVPGERREDVRWGCARRLSVGRGCDQAGVRTFAAAVPQLERPQLAREFFGGDKRPIIVFDGVCNM